MKILSYCVDEIEEYIQAFGQCLPGRSGILLRSIICSLTLKKCGSGIAVQNGVTIKGRRGIELGERVSLGLRSSLYSENEGLLTIGDRVSTNQNVLISSSEKGAITIGNDVIIGPNTVIRASNHRYSEPDLPIRNQGHIPGKIVIEDDVWIASNVVIVSGAHIEKGCVIAAGAVVNSRIPAYSVAGGVPARIIKMRNQINDQISG